MRKLSATLLFLFVCLLGEIPLSAQLNRWDKALNQYERICDESIDLRNRLAAGESVSASALASLQSRLGELRKSLQNAEGQMTPSQLERFLRIRDRYLNQAQTPREPLMAVSPANPRLTGEILPSTTGHPDLLSPLGYRMARPCLPEAPPLSFGCTVLANLPEGFPGLMVFAQRKDIGGYLKGTFSFAPHTSYDALSDGTAGASLIWTTGRERYAQYSLSGGLVYSVNTSVRLYGGAGYGTQDVRWEDASGKWARITDLSFQGLTVDAGVLLSFGHWLVQGGVVLRDQGRLKVETGLGWRF